MSLFLGGLIWLNEWGRSGVKVDSAIYYSLSAFCQTPYLEDGSINSRSVRLQDRVLMLALGWFVMISLATYTAELASFLTARKVTIAIGDFQVHGAASPLLPVPAHSPACESGAALTHSLTHPLTHSLTHSWEEWVGGKGGGGGCVE